MAAVNRFMGGDSAHRDAPAQLPDQNMLGQALVLRSAEHVLIWQLRWGIPMRRITTHEAVDRSHSRRDPRAFRWEKFDRAWLQAAASCGISAEGPYGLDAMPQI